MEKEEKETLLKLADYADKHKKQAILRAVILFSLELICCGYTIAVMIFSLQSENYMSMFIVKYGLNYLNWIEKY